MSVNRETPMHAEATGPVVECMHLVELMLDTILTRALLYATRKPSNCGLAVSPVRS